MVAQTQQHNRIVVVGTRNSQNNFQSSSHTDKHLLRFSVLVGSTKVVSSTKYKEPFRGSWNSHASTHIYIKGTLDTVCGT